jgi:DUF1365 family protein
MTHSAIYEGRVRHRRFAVRQREFSYPVYLAYLDLEEVTGLLGGRLTASRPGIVRFRRSDYLGDPTVSLDDAVRETVSQQTGLRPDGPVRLLTNLRTFGHCFNPVSFYYCFDAAGERVQAVAAEVTNTPWGEHHTYVLPRLADTSGTVLGGRSDKQLHVSPFMGMEHEYRWRMAEPGAHLSAHIESHRAGRLAFDATLNLRRRPFHPRTLASVCARQPAVSLGVLAHIYAQALALKLRGVPVHPHAPVSAG